MSKNKETKSYYVQLDGEKIHVSEEVYRAYYRPVWRESKQAQVRKDTECSLDDLKNSGFEPASNESLVDDLVADKLLLDELYAALDELSDDERGLIDALFFNDKSEREVSRETGVPRKTIAYRKTKLLGKLKKIIEKM